MLSARELADRFHSEWLAAHPFVASVYGIPGYDECVPDASEAGDATRRSSLEGVVTEARRLEGSGVSTADAVTLGCLIGHAEQELAGLEMAPVEHTVTAMPIVGPAELLAIAARTKLADQQAAEDYLERLRRSGPWLDQQTQRLQEGARKGRFPVAPLVEQTIRWADGVLGPPIPDALALPLLPAGSAGETEWRNERDAAVSEIVKPALGRWVHELRDLLPRARPSERPGLAYLPGGAADYAKAIRSHTTMEVTAEQLHQTGLDEIEVLEQRALELGSTLGLRDLDAIHEAIRASSGQRRPEEAIEAAVVAVRRAEAFASRVFPEPLPPPCVVTPMPAVVAASGMAPHYTPPKLDGTRPGTFWFNTDIPTAGTGWELEGVTFHETVPGHHLQLSRLQMLSALSDMQRFRHITVFGEGWGLYAEQLAEEMGLYSDTENLLGAVTAALMRATRLVLDTGLHSFGWSRDRALEFFTAHVPLPPEFLASETDRYIAWPGQALAYLTGKLEILRIREAAQRHLGSSFSLPEFHAALLDSGSLPMPVLAQSMGAWLDGVAPSSGRASL